MWKCTAVVATLSGCFVEARGRAEATAIAGTAVGGESLAWAITAGLELALDRDARYHALLGGGRERVVTASRDVAVGKVAATRLEAGVACPLTGLADFVRGFDLRFAVAGLSAPAGGDVSELRLGGAIRVGGDHLAFDIGPALSYWDAARDGIAYGIGVEAALHLTLDPRQLLP